LQTIIIYQYIAIIGHQDIFERVGFIARDEDNTSYEAT
jgi:hypothetical protein